MKYIILGFLILLIFNNLALAEVTGEILSYKLSDNGSIEVHTQYKIDGIEVPSRYPQEDGKYYWATRYNVDNFAGMDSNQIKVRIFKDVQDYAEVLIKDTFRKIQNTTNVLNQINNAKIIGVKQSFVTAPLLVDKSQSGKPDTKWDVSTDGSYIESPYIPPLK